jgi:hypothetical protein
LFFFCSNFSDVFDEDHFINALANDVKVIKKLPKEIGSSMKAVKYFRSWSGMDYYQEEIASMWADYKVYQLEVSLGIYDCNLLVLLSFIIEILTQSS